MKSVFINEAFNKAINDYLASKDKTEGVLYNSFLVVVIRILVLIYGELDIINPYQMNNEGSFDNNLKKFGASIADVNRLKVLLDNFYQLDKNGNQDNKYFIDVQKCLIDLFQYRRLNYGCTKTENSEFFDLLYTPGTSNPLRLSYNYMHAKDVYEVAKYYSKLPVQKEEQQETKKDIIGFDVYKMFDLSIADISKLNSNELKNVNSQIYKSLDINENAVNREYLLKEKVKEYNILNTPMTSGNGYVDILIVMSIILTAIMTIGIVFMVII